MFGNADREQTLRELSLLPDDLLVEALERRGFVKVVKYDLHPKTIDIHCGHIIIYNETGHDGFGTRVVMDGMEFTNHTEVDVRFRMGEETTVTLSMLAGTPGVDAAPPLKKVMQRLYELAQASQEQFMKGAFSKKQDTVNINPKDFPEPEVYEK